MSCPCYRLPIEKVPRYLRHLMSCPSNWSVVQWHSVICQCCNGTQLDWGCCLLPSRTGSQAVSLLPAHGGCCRVILMRMCSVCRTPHRRPATGSSGDTPEEASSPAQRLAPPPQRAVPTVQRNAPCSYIAPGAASAVAGGAGRPQHCSRRQWRRLRLQRCQLQPGFSALQRGAPEASAASGGSLGRGFTAPAG